MEAVLMVLWIVEAGLTVLGVMLFIWHGLLEFREEDDVLLGTGQTHLVHEQAAIQQEAMALERYLRLICGAWGVVLAAIGVVWVLKQLNY